MANATDVRCRLCLVTPPDYEPDSFSRTFADALAGGDVASVIITAPRGGETEFQAAAALLVPIAAARGVASLIHNDTRVASRTKADGVHIDSGAGDLRAAIEAFRGRQIVGAGNMPTRHEALEAGESDPDYVFFGRLDGDRNPEIFPKALDLAAWWSSVTIIPAMVMGGNALSSVDAAAANGVAFVALSSAVWSDPRGAAAAVAEVGERLAIAMEPAA